MLVYRYEYKQWLVQLAQADYYFGKLTRRLLHFQIIEVYSTLFFFKNNLPLCIHINLIFYVKSPKEFRMCFLLIICELVVKYLAVHN